MEGDVQEQYRGVSIYEGVIVTTKFFKFIEPKDTRRSLAQLNHINALAKKRLTDFLCCS